MKKTIMFCLNPAISHFLPTIPLSQALRNKGYKIIYLGFSNLESRVKEEGFEFITIKAASNQDLINLREKYKFLSLSKLYKEIITEIKNVISEQEIALSIIDISRFNLFFIPSFECNVPILSFWTCSGATNINFRIPPNSSTLIPNENRSFDIRAGSLWFKRYFKKEFIPYVLLSKLFYPHTRLRNVATKSGLKWKYNIDGAYIDTPKIIFGPGGFEFPNTNETGYLGLCVTEERQNVNFNWDIIHNEEPLVYCSLGTMSHRYPYSMRFFQTVIDAFAEHTDWQLVINIGSTGTRADYPTNTKNVFVFDHVPQLEILKRASLVITHGGYGTIKECINYAVPLIVFPCTYDQPGNAARIEYHQIGLKGDMKTISSGQLSSMVNEVLNNNMYKKSVEALREKISTESLVRGMGIIEALIEKRA